MKTLLISIVLLLLGIAIGIGINITFQRLNHRGNDMDTADMSEMSSTSAPSKEKKILYWVAPMDPSYRRDKPGKSPMGMDLVPVYEEDNSGEQGVVKISASVENNLGVRTAIVDSGKLWRKIKAVGMTTYDERNISHVHLRTEGWIENLSVKATGEMVKQGQLLFQLYSPELVNAQEELLQARQSGNQGLIQASKRRLFSLGMSRTQVKHLLNTQNVPQKIGIYSPQTGTVSKLNVREGMFVKPQTIIMELVDLSSMWMIVEIFEQQASWVKIGQFAEVNFDYQPGQIWQAKVDYIYPDLDPKTRTLRVRLKFDNPELQLKANMYGKVVIYGGAKLQVLSIPREALIPSGDGYRVVIAMGNGRYQSRFVKVGIESGNWVEILSGLEEGEKVVVSAQFLIDSEASLNASFTRMSH